MAFQRRDRRDRRDDFEEEGGLEDSVVQIYRCSKVVKGGRRFSFAALVVVGDRNGQVGLGYGKANEVPSAVDKAKSDAIKNMFRVPLRGGTVPHEILGRSGASSVVLVPASEGTGVIAGKKIRPLFELAGVHDLLTKSYGSTSPKNLLKAGVRALKKLRTAATVGKLRGVELS